jgi:hypothetical protein
MDVLSSLHDASCLCDLDVHAVASMGACLVAHVSRATAFPRSGCFDVRAATVTRSRMAFSFLRDAMNTSRECSVLFAVSRGDDNPLELIIAFVESNLTREFTCQPVLVTTKVHPGAFR